MSFMDKMKAILDQAKTTTENGAIGYVTSGHALVDMNFRIPQYRKMDEREILSDFLSAFAEDPELAIKWMFYAGDIREGLGERRLFKILVKNVLPKYPHLISLIPEYSRWDVVFELIDQKNPSDETTKLVLKMVGDQIQRDLHDMADHKPVSLLAKWMPSNNTSSKEKVRLANFISQMIGMSPREYRKALSKLRAYLNVTEVKMCAKNWKDIDYQSVPSKANLRYKNAFLRNDEARRREFLDSLKKGEAKINAGVCTPPDIVAAYSLGRYVSNTGVVDDALEAMWKSLKSVEVTKPLIVVRDGSGSMTESVGNCSALDVATALAIYTSERNVGEFKDKYITFSSCPKFVDLSNLLTLRDKILRSYEEDDCADTNIEATMDLILQTAVENHIKQEEIPDVMIISDMEFNSAIEVRNRSRNRASQIKALFEVIEEKFKASGYKLPSVIFWNVNSRTGAIPLQQNELGVKLLSGFSQNILKMAMSNKLDPMAVLKETLLSDRYKDIH